MRQLADQMLRRGISIVTGIALVLICLSATAQDSPQKPPYRFVEPCVSRQGDDPAWRETTIDDSEWQQTAWPDLKFPLITWLRCRVSVDEAFQTGDFPLGVFLIGTLSYEMWWDGRLIGSNGIVGANPEAEQPGRLNSVQFVAPEWIGAGEHVLAMRISAHHATSRIDTPLDAFYFGAYTAPLNASRQSYLPTFLSAGALSLSLLFLLVSGWRLRDKASLWLSGACVALLIQLGLEVSRALVNYVYSWHACRLLGVSLAALVVGVCLMGYLRQRFGGGLIWHLPLFLVAAIALPTLNQPDLVTILLLTTTAVSGIGLTIRARRHGRKDAWLAMLALTLLILWAVIDPYGFLDRDLYIGFSLVMLLIFVDHARAVLRIRREAQQARLNSTRLQLELMKKQLQPHFLMNTLTSLLEWIETAPKTAVKMITALAEKFRMLNAMVDQSLIDLDQELALCRTHLQIMAYRHETRFDLVVDGDTSGVRVPPAVIHTLIENALTHGDLHDQESRQLTLEIRQYKSQHRMRFLGSKVQEDQVAGEGTGLGYLHARLAEAFGSHYEFSSGLNHPENTGDCLV